MDDSPRFRPLTRDDFPLLAHWLRQPHVQRWWNHETTPDAVEADFGAVVDRDDPAEVFIASWDGRPTGLIQRYTFADNPGYGAELSHLLSVPPGAFSMDYFIGEPASLRRGCASAMLRRLVDDTWAVHPGASAIIVPVVAVNFASWRALERAGFRRVAEGELEPDNPIDPRDHLVYRIDRP